MFPEINKAWIQNRKEQYKDVEKSGKPVELGVDGQCDSPGNSATYILHRYCNECCHK